MFLSQYEHSVDDKGRTIIPAKYREDLGSTFYVTRGLDECLYLYPEDEWSVFAEKLRKLPGTAKNRVLQREFLSKAVDVTMDKQGRVLIPANLKKLAGIKKDVVFVGLINRIEVWDKEKRAEAEAGVTMEMMQQALEEVEIVF